MKVKRITKKEYQEISELKDTYFLNSVVFDEKNDNVLAFENLEADNTFSYWKVIECENG